MQLEEAEASAGALGLPTTPNTPRNVRRRSIHTRRAVQLEEAWASAGARGLPRSYAKGPNLHNYFFDVVVLNDRHRISGPGSKKETGRTRR